MESEITYFASYSCPHCKAELEARQGGWSGWLRCPSCGVPSLPPELMFARPQIRHWTQDPNNEDGEIMVIAAPPEGSAAPDRASLAGSSPISALRLIFLTGFILSLFLLLIAFVDQQK